MKILLKIILILSILFIQYETKSETYGEVFEKYKIALCSGDEPKRYVNAMKLINSANNPYVCSNTLVIITNQLNNYFSKNEFNKDICLEYMNEQMSTVIEACTNK